MKRFAEDTKELSKETSWWEKIDRIKPEEKRQEPVKEATKSDKELRKQIKRQIKEEKKRKKQKKRRRHSSNSSSDSDKKEAKRQRLEVMRKERLERELAEQRRVRQLIGETVQEDKLKEPTYSNQFNPDLVRRR